MVTVELIQPAHILWNQIETKRNEMIATGMQYGLSHVLTIQLSQELDKLLNDYDQINT